MKQRVNIISFLICISLAFQSLSFAASDIPANQLCSPVLVSFTDGSSASGFYFQTKDYMHFVTAKHVLYKEDGTLKNTNATLLSYGWGINEANKIEARLDLGELQKKGLIRKSEKHDVTVVRVGKVISTKDKEGTIAYELEMQIKAGITNPIVSSGNPKVFDQVLVGNEVFIFGYPISIGIKEMDQIKYDQPLLRKGVIAGKNVDKETLILDCPTYYGNSGGPVIEVDRLNLTEIGYYLIGLVSQFVPFRETLVNTTHHFSYWQISNSGYSIIEPFDPIAELLWENKNIKPIDDAANKK